MRVCKIALLALAIAATLSIPSWGSRASSASSIAVGDIDLSAFPRVSFSADVAGINAKPDPSLTLENFEVTQSGVPVRGLEVRRELTGAVDVVIAVDLSGSQVNFIEQSKKAAIDLVNSLAPSDRVEIFAFHNQTERLLPLTADRNAIGNVLNGLTAIPNSNTAMNSAILSAVQAADAAAGPGRVVVVISDGQEFGSRSLPVEQQILDTALARGIQTYTLYIGDQPPSILFNEVAGNTGGLRLAGAEAASIGAHIRETLRSQYFLSFTNSAPLTADPAEIVVRVKSRETAETAVNLCDGQAAPIAWIPGIDDGQKLSGERRLEPRLLCAGGRSIQQAQFYLDDERLAAASSPPFTYNLIADKLEREPHALRVDLTLSDGTQVSSTPLNVSVSGSPFNPAYLLILLGLAAAMVVGAFAMIRRKQSRSLATTPVDATAPAFAAVGAAAGTSQRGGVALAEPPLSSVEPVQPSRQGLLRVVRGPTEGQSYPLGASLVLGRAPTSDVLLSGSSISREHARIWFDGSAYRIRDLGSTNGTLVNGARVTEAVLSAGDQIEIRPFVFEFGG